MFNIIFANDWIGTVDLWSRKWPLYQLSHNYYPFTEILSNHFLIQNICKFYFAQSTFQIRLNAISSSSKKAFLELIKN